MKGFARAWTGCGQRASIIRALGGGEEVLESGKRICHVRYGYASDAHSDGGEQLTRGVDLVSQTDVMGYSRSYAYRHHLLTACTRYTGFEQVVEWISQAALRARWEGSLLDDPALALEFPITAETSYQARAVASRAVDGSEGAGLSLQYLDNDTTRVCENGDTLDYTFDANWLVTRICRMTSTGRSCLGRREWDQDGMLLAEIDGLGRAARYTYDDDGNLTSSQDPAGYITHITYDAKKQAVRITDPMGNVSTRTYDEVGRLASVTNALGNATAYYYDDKGRLIKQVDAKGGTSHLEYDKAGNVRKAIDCSGYATKFRYDQSGRLESIIPPDAEPGEQTRFGYDALGRVTEIIQPDGSSEGYAFDAAGNLLMHTDALGYETRFRYNGQGMLIEQTNAMG